MKLAITGFVLTLLISACSASSGPQVVKRDGDTMTVRYQGQEYKIKPDDGTPQSAKGIAKQGVFISADKAAEAAAVHVIKRYSESTHTVPTEGAPAPRQDASDSGDAGN